jgi:hypothetical protein
MLTNQTKRNQNPSKRLVATWQPASLMMAVVSAPGFTYCLNHLPLLTPSGLNTYVSKQAEGIGNIRFNDRRKSVT